MFGFPGVVNSQCYSSRSEGLTGLWIPSCDLGLVFIFSALYNFPSSFSLPCAAFSVLPLFLSPTPACLAASCCYGLIAMVTVGLLLTSSLATFAPSATGQPAALMLL